MHITGGNEWPKTAVIGNNCNKSKTCWIVFIGVPVITKKYPQEILHVKICFLAFFPKKRSRS